MENGPKIIVSSRKAFIRRSKRGVSIDGGLEATNGLLKSSPGALVEFKATFEVTLVNSRCHRSAALHRHSDFNVTRNATGHIALQRQYVLQFAVISCSPQVFVRAGPNQLNSDANLVSGSQH